MIDLLGPTDERWRGCRSEASVPAENYSAPRRGSHRLHRDAEPVLIFGRRRSPMILTPLLRRLLNLQEKYDCPKCLVDLPSMGIRGNTHFPFSDLNNLEIADEMSRFLAEKGVDGFNNDGS